MPLDSTSCVCPNLMAPASALARLKVTMSSSVFIGASAGSVARYAFRSRLNSYGRMLGGSPPVSTVDEIGSTPLRLTSPTVGFTPTTELAVDGLRIEPDVSVPTVIVASAAAAATAGPELDVLGVWLASYGLSTCPPRPLYPDGMPAVVKLANSVRFALPRTTAPADFSRVTRNALRRGNERCRASAPAVVGSPAT